MNRFRLTWGNDLNENMIIITNANKKQLEGSIKIANELYKLPNENRPFKDIIQYVLENMDFDCNFILLDYQDTIDIS